MVVPPQQQFIQMHRLREKTSVLEKSHAVANLDGSMRGCQLRKDVGTVFQDAFALDTKNQTRVPLMRSVFVK